jgi:hypothetical protein
MCAGSSGDARFTCSAPVRTRKTAENSRFSSLDPAARERNRSDHFD